MVDSFGNISSGHLKNQALPASEIFEKQAEQLKKSGDDAAIRKFSQDFEALFIQRLMEEMRKSIPKGGSIDRSMSIEWFEGMFDQAVAKEISAGEGMGMARVIYEQLTRKAGGERPGGSLPAKPAPADRVEISQNTKKDSDSYSNINVKKGGVDE
jgi:flagellar protein FlgJ